MSLDNLLLWLSAKGQGSWSQFRGAVEELYAGEDYRSLLADDEGERYAASSGLPVYQRIRFALERLGHVEFFTNNWRVVPPALALLSRSSGDGVLCGARSPNLLHSLNNELEVNRVTVPGMPDRLAVRGAYEAVVLGAARVGVLVQADAPMTILSATPSVREPAMWSPAAIPETAGWTVHRFSSSRLGWIESTGGEANARTGLFRFVMGHQRFHYLRWRGYSYRVQVQVGKYAVMRTKRGHLIYDATRRMLSVPVVCRPPLLIERAIILCCGILPSFNLSSNRLEYANVTPDVAFLAAQLLCQEFTR